MDAETPSGAEAPAARSLIEAAGARLRQGSSGAPADFAAALFSRTDPEDLVRYTASELAALAESAWSFLSERKPGAPSIRFEPSGVAAGDRAKPFSVLDIVNDDMPFLVDSVLAELTEQGVDIRLVAHPVLAVERDQSGRLTGFAVPRPAAGGPPEDFRHNHPQAIGHGARRHYHV